jgi:polyisoprenoid-binding protein YceI
MHAAVCSDVTSSSLRRRQVRRSDRGRQLREARLRSWHLVVSKVHGRFDAFSGTVVTDEDLARTSVSVSIEAASVNIHLAVRDSQVRSAAFLDAENFPYITFASTAVRAETGRYFVDGDLTIRGTTRPVTLDLDVNGFSPDTFGATRVSFSATTTIDRNDFGGQLQRADPRPRSYDAAE